MAKFCTKCGKPLVDGKPCDCEKNENQNEVEQVSFNSNGLLETVKGMFTRPVSTLQEFVQDHNLVGNQCPYRFSICLFRGKRNY